MKLVKVHYQHEGCDRTMTMTCDPATMKNDVLKALKDIHPDGGYVIKEICYSSYDVEEYPTTEE